MVIEIEHVVPEDTQSVELVINMKGNKKETFIIEKQFIDRSVFIPYTKGNKMPKKP